MTPAHDEPGRTEAQPPRTETFPEGLRYDAFISYSRHNLDVADKIERDLERFPLPRDIRKSWDDDTSTCSGTSAT
jgi:hypothetical protein